MSDTVQTSAADLNEQARIRREKLAALREAGSDPYQITRFPQTARSASIKANFEAMEGKEVSIAGRLMYDRVVRKSSFCPIHRGE